MARRRRRNFGLVRRTPLVRAEALSEEAGADKYFFHLFFFFFYFFCIIILQPQALTACRETGSFKLRGATNRLAQLTGR